MDTPITALNSLNCKEEVFRAACAYEWVEKLSDYFCNATECNCWTKAVGTTTIRTFHIFRRTQKDYSTAMVLAFIAHQIAIIRRNVSSLIAYNSVS